MHLGTLLILIIVLYLVVEAFHIFAHHIAEAAVVVGILLGGSLLLHLAALPAYAVYQRMMVLAPDVTGAVTDSLILIVLVFLPVCFIADAFSDFDTSKWIVRCVRARKVLP